MARSTRPSSGEAHDDPAAWREESHDGILRTAFRVKRSLCRRRSEHQEIEVVETDGFGRMLFLDGVAQVSERDERIYHEMAAHVPLFVHPDPQRVLVIGGGDGGTVREVLRHRSVRCCRLVEIDAVVIEVCREHLPALSGALDDPRVEVTVADAARWIRQTREEFDVVIVDSTDPVGPGRALFTAELYETIRGRLRPEGIVVSQAGSPFHSLSAQVELLEMLRPRFRGVFVYNYANLTYPAGLWSFSYAATSERCPVASLDATRIERSGLSFAQYSAAVHRAAFALPAFQERELAQLGVRSPHAGEPHPGIGES